MDSSLQILIVEDEILIALELESLLQDSGHSVVGIAASSEEALALGAECRPDLAFVDIHLADGPTGVEVARSLAREHGIMVLFMTANAKRIPDDFTDAHGVISKPYTERGVQQALDYVIACRDGAGPPSIDTLTFMPFQNRGLRAPSQAQG
ncbi:MAG TPA: response regulator [Microvirga sp.]|jgi:CheY-like chemotaxis protein|nr:response regulator [Microvirga sp.]